jgi:AcrR family transcriptional regulator
MPSETAYPPAAVRTPQRKRGRARVAALMAAASALFVERGYDAATMTEIAANAGASIGSLYLFFPTKQVLAQAMMAAMGDALSARLDALRSRTEGCSAAELADALFGELALFLAEHPVYGVLIDLPGQEGWKRALLARRRAQIAALFAQVRPVLPADQAERLALIVPQLMRITMTLTGEPHPLRDEVLDELRAMLRHHLEWPAQ